MEPPKAGQYIVVHGYPPDTCVEAFDSYGEALDWVIGGGTNGSRPVFALVVDPVELATPEPCAICGAKLERVHDAEAHRRD